MSLLAFEHVCKRYGSGAGEHAVLTDVSFEVYPAELLAVWGRRDSGRSTLLALAAGLQAPSSGVVRFQGRDLQAGRGQDLGDGIGYCRRTFRASEDAVVKDHLLVDQLARGVSPKRARARAWSSLERVQASHCATRSPAELDTGELVRVMLARALTLQPSLLVIDEPTRGVDLLERDEILTLLRSLADEGTAILSCNGETTALAGAHRALSLSEGELRGNTAPELAPVTDLSARRQSAG
jgi:putative ABC transport system ATP-binding protein